MKSKYQPPERLYAKSRRGEADPVTLVQHAQDVADAFATLFGGKDAPSYFGTQWLRFFRLGEESRACFYASGLVACLLHDIGKANNSFQKAMAGSAMQQFVRHEHLSAFLLNGKVLSAWLKGIPSVDLGAVISAVLGHHLKSAKEDFGVNIIKAGNSMRVEAQHSNYRELLEITANEMGVGMPTGFEADGGCWNEDKIYDEQDALMKLAATIDNKCRDDTDYWRLLLAVKAALIVADAVGSGVVGGGYKIADWIEERTGERKRLKPGDIKRDIIDPRIKQITQGAADKVAPSAFQRDAGGLGSRALLLAPCGSGKTLAAWLWIEVQIASKKASRVLFLYPTRGTAGEGFKDYVSHAPEADAGLLTGTARFQLQAMHSNPKGDETEKDFEQNINEKLFKLGQWDKRIFSATAHQFLAFMQQNYGSLCLLPLLADSIVVIDEVHSFDNKMFNALARFLKEFDVPALCMTASLPHSHRQKLEGVGLVVYPPQQDTSGCAELEKSANLSRYDVVYKDEVSSRDGIVADVRQFINGGKKVLWVVNTVNECQEIAQALYVDCPELVCYHSRFKLEHRLDQQDAIVKAFAPGSKSDALGITTQVCEMSLDIDADILVTQIAPIPALIQRMGRCNRHADKKGRIGEVIVYHTPQESVRPYYHEDIAQAQIFMAELCQDGGRDISQKKLEELLEVHTKDQSTGEGWERFLEDKFWSKSGDSLTEEGDFTVPAIFRCDVEKYKELRNNGKPTDGLILPCPKSMAKCNNESRSTLPRYLRIVGDRAYYSWYDDDSGQRLGLLKKSIDDE